jgi:hypothetical protein
VTNPALRDLVKAKVANRCSGVSAGPAHRSSSYQRDDVAISSACNMDEEGCNKGVNAFGNPLCAPVSDGHFNLFACSNELVRNVLCLLASVMGQTATNLNKIRLHAIQMSTDGNQTKVVITGYLYHATAAICMEASNMMSKVTNTIATSGCATEEKQMFEELNREAAEVLVRLKELREDEITLEDVRFEGLIVTKLAMLCHAIWTDALGEVAKRRGICALREESINGLWLNVICTCIGIARSRLRALLGETKALKRRTDVLAFVGRFVGVVGDLKVDLKATENLMEVIGEGMAPPTPVALKKIDVFETGICSVTELLERDWRGLAPCENDQRVPLQHWVAEEDENLGMISPHPVPAPCIGSWYTYVDV